MKPDPQQPDKALCVDVLAPEGYGEIIGGGQRVDDLDCSSSASASTICRRKRSSGISTCGGTAACPTAGSAWASSASSRGFAASSTCARRFRIRGCCIGCIRNRFYLRPRSSPRPASRPPCARTHEDWNDLPRLPEEPRGFRGDARAGAAGRARADAAMPPTPTCSSSIPARSSTRPSRNRSTPSSRWPSTRKRGGLPSAYRHRLHGRALSRRTARRDSRDRRGARHRRSPRIVDASASESGAQVGQCLFLPLRANVDACSRLVQHGGRAPDAGTELRAADLPLRRRHPASDGDAAPLRVRQDCRGLRLQVRVLHHSDASRPLPEPTSESIVVEARMLAARGVKELLLISQDTTFYGVDRGERGALARLLRELNRSTDSNGFGCCTSIPRPSPTMCWMRWPTSEKVCNTSTCRCSMRRIPC